MRSAGSDRDDDDDVSSREEGNPNEVMEEEAAMPPPEPRVSTPSRRGGNTNNAADVQRTPLPADDSSIEGGGDSLVPPTPAAQQPPGTPLTPLSPLDVEDEEEEEPVMEQGEGGGGGAGVGDEDDGSEEMQQEEPLLDDQQMSHIRGTDVHVPTAAAAFTDFLQNFRSLRHSQRQQQQQQRENDNDDDDSLSTMDSAEEDAPPLYVQKLERVLTTGPVGATASLDLDTMHLYYHSAECQVLYQQLQAYPMEVIPLMDLLVQRQLERIAARLENHPYRDDPSQLPRLQVRPFHLKNVSHVRALDPVAMDTLVCIQGMIVRTSPIIPDLKVAHFGCTVCGHAVEVPLDRGRITEPTGRCPTCGVAAYQLQHNRCIFADKQLVRLQETPDEVPAGQTPASVVTFCYDDIVDRAQPGDKVELTGILRAQSARVHPRISKVRAVYKTYLDIIHFRKVTGREQEERSDGAEAAHQQFSPERVEQLKHLSRDPDIYQKLTDSLAPSIWELEDCKKGILCMLFGGNHLRVRRGTAARRRQNEQDRQDSWLDEDDDDDGGGDGTSKLNKRGDINILLCGDPGTSKSQLLSFVHKLSARGVYTSGKGSSAVGLTASVVRDPETRDLVLESGALVLSDLGICCIDELDKMSDTTRSVLHEAMEQQTVSIAKAGIIATLHARTSVLASANPLESRYNPNRSVVDNIQLPPTLLSRFDLIYLILDSPNVENDRRLAQHLVGLYYETPNVVEPPLDHALLRDYIEYARQNVHPEMSDEASEQLIASYLEMRNPSGGGAYAGNRTISATARQLESLIRLSEALAKMRYSLTVTRADAREAVRLMKVATQAAATDPRTGRIDMDMITTGRSSADREMEEQLELSLRELFAERRGSRMAVRDVTRQLTEILNVSSLEHDDVVKALRQMHEDGVIQFHERNQTIFVRAGVVR